MYKHRIKHLPGDGDDDNPEEDHEEPQLLVGLLHGAEQGLQASEVAHKLPGKQGKLLNCCKIFDIFEML